MDPSQSSSATLTSSGPKHSLGQAPEDWSSEVKDKGGPQTDPAAKNDHSDSMRTRPLDLTDSPTRKSGSFSLPAGSSSEPFSRPFISVSTPDSLRRSKRLSDKLRDFPLLHLNEDVEDWGANLLLAVGASASSPTKARSLEMVASQTPPIRSTPNIPAPLTTLDDPPHPSPREETTPSVHPSPTWSNIMDDPSNHFHSDKVDESVSVQPPYTPQPHSHSSDSFGNRYIHSHGPSASSVDTNLVTPMKTSQSGQGQTLTSPQVQSFDHEALTPPWYGGAGGSPKTFGPVRTSSSPGSDLSLTDAMVADRYEDSLNPNRLKSIPLVYDDRSPPETNSSGRMFTPSPLRQHLSGESPTIMISNGLGLELSIVKEPQEEIVESSMMSGDSCPFQAPNVRPMVVDFAPHTPTEAGLTAAPSRNSWIGDADEESLISPARTLHSNSPTTTLSTIRHGDEIRSSVTSYASSDAISILHRSIDGATVQMASYTKVLSGLKGMKEGSDGTRRLSRVQGPRPNTAERRKQRSRPGTAEKSLSSSTDINDQKIPWPRETYENGGDDVEPELEELKQPCPFREESVERSDDTHSEGAHSALDALEAAAREIAGRGDMSCISVE